MYRELTLVSQVGTLARRKKFNKSIVIKSVVASFSDSTDRLETAFTQRLDLGAPILHMFKRGALQCGLHSAGAHDCSLHDPDGTAS